MTSAVAALVRSAAEQGGHDKELAMAMVRRELEYKIGDKVISEEGQVLTLTNEEAAQQFGDENRPLLSSGTAADIQAMLKQLGLEGATQHELKVTAAERLARLIATVAPLLMMIGLGGLWLEFKTPGFGIFGIAGITCLLLFFFGHHIAGLAGMEDLLLFFLGVTLLGIEIFVTPGFGFMGISGLILILLSLVSAMTERMPGQWRPIDFSPETFSTPIINVSVALIGATVLALIAGKFLPKTKVFQSLTLEETISGEAEELSLVGLTGVCRSDLRPTGTALIGDRRLDVITKGEYLVQNSPIRIIEVHGNRIVVEQA